MFLFEVDTKRELNVTQNPWTDTQGTITPDGTRVIFVSDRNDGVAQLFSVPLARLTEDPNDPLVRERIRRAQGNRRPPPLAETGALRRDRPVVAGAVARTSRPPR